jgi:hypothetical protein
LHFGPAENSEITPPSRQADLTSSGDEEKFKSFAAHLL